MPNPTPLVTLPGIEAKRLYTNPLTGETVAWPAHLHAIEPSPYPGYVWAEIDCPRCGRRYADVGEAGRVLCGGLEWGAIRTAALRVCCSECRTEEDSRRAQAERERMAPEAVYGWRGCACCPALEAPHAR